MYTDQSVMERTARHLFATDEELAELGFKRREIDKMHRIRGAYAFWQSRPSVGEKEVIAHVRATFEVSYRVAWEDVTLCKMCLGNLSQCTKQYKEWLFYQRFEEAWEKARAEETPARAMAALLSTYVKATRIDREEPQGPDYASIVPQQFVITADPEDAGFKAMPGAEEKAKKLLARYTREAQEAGTAREQPAGGEEGAVEADG